MPIHRSVFKEKYKDYSIEQLKERLLELKNYHTFENKKEQLEFNINRVIIPTTPGDISKFEESEALTELLNEKSNGTETVEIKVDYTITLEDYISYVVNDDPFWTTTISKFLSNIQDEPFRLREEFLCCLYHDKKNFNEFTKEILKCNDYQAVYDKYYQLATEYVRKCIESNPRYGMKG